jgi:predicted DNA binding CopG/RHH family protein
MTETNTDTGAEGGTRERVLATIRSEIAADRAAALAQADPVARARLLERAGIRDELAEEEAEAIAEEIAENKETALSVRVPESLSRALKQRARVEHVAVSVLVRRLLAEAVYAEPAPAPLTVAQVEEIARRVARETLAG